MASTLRYAASVLTLLIFFNGCATAAATKNATSTSSGDSSDFVRTSDLTKINQLGQLAISPDGSKAVYVLQTTERNKDDDGYRYMNQLWMVNLESGDAPYQLTRHESGASQPAWHPDSQHIAFTRSVDGTSQIFVLNTTGGEARQFTDQKNGASSPAWSPDGDRILFASSYSHSDLLGMEDFKDGPQWPHEKPGIDPLPLNHDVTPDPDGSIEEVRAWLAKNEGNRNPAVLNRIDFQGEFNLNPARSYTHWYVMANEPKATPEAITLHTGFYSFSGGAWLQDGSGIILSGSMDNSMHPDRNAEQDLYRFSASDGSYEQIASREHYTYTGPVVSPNGRYVAFRAFDTRERGYNQAEIGILDLQNGDVQHLGSNLDRSLGNTSWSHDNRHVYATAPKNGGFPLFRFDVRNGSYERLTGHETGIRDYAVSRNALLFVQTDYRNPFELYRARTDASRAERISDHNHSWISERTISEPIKYSYTTDDNFEVEYWVMKPAGYTEGETYPTLLQIHGGPSAMWGTGEASMWHEFQLFAAHGFGVVFSNPRGSGGYGYDFQSGNRSDWGTSPMNDVLGALDAAAANYSWIDEDQLTITGGSYGGYLVAFTVAKDHRFKAAAAQRGVYDLPAFLGEGNAYRLVNDQFGGYPWDEDVRENILFNSPFTHVNLIETPLLILHGDNDLRTGVSQSEMMYRALKLQEKEVEYIRYPGAGHDLSRTGDVHQRKDRLLRMIEFMKRYVD
ncbi:MAG: S9 family peptidase [Balneolia bacterium]|nr:S9 family peptidase [Balneolia bacterium]